MPEQPSRNWALDLARVTKSAAQAAGRHMGRGNKKAGDQAKLFIMNEIALGWEGLPVVQRDCL